MTFPNYLTIARILSVPVVVWLIGSEYYIGAFWVFVFAGLSDGIDGYIARRFGLTSALGAYLDPIADKLLLVAIYISLGIVSRLPDWLVITVVARDLFIVGGVGLSAFIGKPIYIHPLQISKIATTAQMIFAAIILSDLRLEAFYPNIFIISALMVTLLTLASAFAYLREWVKHMAGE